MVNCLTDRIVQRNISQILRAPFSGALLRSGVFFLVRKQFNLKGQLLCIGTNRHHCLKKSWRQNCFCRQPIKSRIDKYTLGDYLLSDSFVNYVTKIFLMDFKFF